MTEEKPKRKTSERPRKATQNTQKPQTALTTENIVLVGNKPVMNYVIACLTSFNSGAQKVVVKARGRAISRAVDTVELLRRAFVKDLQLQGISTCTEEVMRDEGQKANVSAIEITVTKP